MVRGLRCEELGRADVGEDEVDAAVRNGRVPARVVREHVQEPGTRIAPMQVRPHAGDGFLRSAGVEGAREMAQFLAFARRLGDGGLDRRGRGRTHSEGRLEQGVQALAGPAEREDETSRMGEHHPAGASCQDLTAIISFRPPSPMSSIAVRNNMSPAIFRSRPSGSIPRKIDSASRRSPARAAKRNERPRWLISPETARGGFGGALAFFSEATKATACRIGRGWNWA